MWTWIQMDVCVCTYMCVRMCVCTCIWARMCMQVHICVYACVCTTTMWFKFQTTINRLLLLKSSYLVTEQCSTVVWLRLMAKAHFFFFKFKEQEAYWCKRKEWEKNTKAPVLGLVHLGPMSGQESHILSVLELTDCGSVIFFFLINNPFIFIFILL